MSAPYEIGQRVVAKHAKDACGCGETALVFIRHMAAEEGVFFCPEDLTCTQPQGRRYDAVTLAGAR